MTREVWRDIAGYEGLYQASNLGRIRSLDRTIRRNGIDVHWKGRILQPKVPYPYLGVMLSKNGKARSFRVHRLVAMAFVPNPDNLPVVDHIDSDKTNNAASNLRWCTNQQNLAFAKEAGLITGPTPFSQRTPEQQEHYSRVRKKAILRSDGKRYECTAEAAEDLGVTYSAVMHVLRGLASTCKGYGFTYA